LQIGAGSRLPPRGRWRCGIRRGRWRGFALGENRLRLRPPRCRSRCRPREKRCRLFGSGGLFLPSSEHPTALLLASFRTLRHGSLLLDRCPLVGSVDPFLLAVAARGLAELWRVVRLFLRMARNPNERAMRFQSISIEELMTTTTTTTTTDPSQRSKRKSNSPGFCRCSILWWCGSLHERRIFPNKRGFAFHGLEKE